MSTYALKRIIMLNTKKCGVLLPIASLPSNEGIGTFGAKAYDFIDYLHVCGVKIWQILPLLPLSYGNSPYSSNCSRAFCHYYIDLDILAQQGLLTTEEIKNADLYLSNRRVDYGLTFTEKTNLLKKAYSRFDKSSPSWREFVSKGTYDDYALFMTLKESNSFKQWTEWEQYKHYDNRLIADFINANRYNFEFWLFTQYECEIQWFKLKKYANERGLSILGDLPIYLAYDSVEVWKYGQELFSLNDDKFPKLVAGVPPDAFSEDGQLWGNPVYDWKKMSRDGYKWWKDRIAYSLSVYDVVRLDHFRGFDRFFAIEANETTAKNGKWLDGPKYELFKDFDKNKIIAEDLGIIDDGVRTLLSQTGYDGMKVMSFGFNGDPYSEHKPSNFPENCVAFTGTHDNAPLKTLFSTADDNQKLTQTQDLESECKKAKIRHSVKSVNGKINAAIDLLFASKANTVIIPFHDLKGFGEEARINAPSIFSDDNWSFRYVESDFDAKTQAKLKKLIIKYGR